MWGQESVHLGDVHVFKCKDSIEWKRQTLKNTDHHMILFIGKSRTAETDQVVIEVKIVTSGMMGLYMNYEELSGIWEQPAF